MARKITNPVRHAVRGNEYGYTESKTVCGLKKASERWVVSFDGSIGWRDPNCKRCLRSRPSRRGEGR